MLKITSFTNNGHTTLVLEGKLIDPWIAELERAWNAVRVGNGGGALIDLKDVTLISRDGEQLLRRMRDEGARFNCCRGIMTKHVVQQLVSKFSAKHKKN